MSERIEIQTLTDGGQQAGDIAHTIAAFLGGATKTLDLAQYDFNLSATRRTSSRAPSPPPQAAA